MSTEIRLCPHEPSFKVLNAHDALRRPVQTLEPTRDKDLLVHDIRNVDRDGLGRFALEPEFAVPRHVLDREEGAVEQDVEVEITVGPKIPAGHALVQVQLTGFTRFSSDGRSVDCRLKIKGRGERDLHKHTISCLDDSGKNLLDRVCA